MLITRGLKIATILELSLLLLFYNFIFFWLLFFFSLIHSFHDYFSYVTNAFILAPCWKIIG